MASRSFLKSSKFGKRKANPSNHLGLLYESMRTGKSTEVELLVKEVTRRVHSICSRSARGSGWTSKILFCLVAARFVSLHRDVSILDVNAIRIGVLFEEELTH